MDINIELIEKHLNIKLKYLNKNNKKEKTFICLYNFFCINNIKICEKIRETTDLLNKYHIISDYNTITIGQMNDRILDNYDIINKNDNKYVLLQYNNTEYIDFKPFLFDLPNPKLFIFHVLDSYGFLLNSLLNLEQKGICFLNLSTKNIVFDRKYKPILRNFETSLLIESCTDLNYFTKIIEKIEDYTYKPLEIHVIFYLIKNNEDSLSFSAIDSICDNFVKNMSILSLFSQQYRENYYNVSIEYLKKYINKQKNEIINDILKSANTWDNYEISVMFLHIFCTTTRSFSLKDTLINKISIVLSKNIGPDPLKRESLKASITIFEKLYHDFNDWEYINSISQEKMGKLHDNLLK